MPTKKKTSKSSRSLISVKDGRLQIFPNYIFSVVASYANVHLPRGVPYTNAELVKLLPARRQAELVKAQRAFEAKLPSPLVMTAADRYKWSSDEAISRLGYAVLSSISNDDEKSVKVAAHPIPPEAVDLVIGAMKSSAIASGKALANKAYFAGAWVASKAESDYRAKLARTRKS